MSTADSDLSGVSDHNYRSTKSSKKSKKKSEKKRKRGKKDKKHRDKEAIHSLDTHKGNGFSQTKSEASFMSLENNHVQSNEHFGPALPPHMLRSEPPRANIIGPQMPKKRDVTAPGTTSESVGRIGSPSSEAEEIPADTFGPLPDVSSPSSEVPLNDAQLKLEQRALELKIAAFDGAYTQKVDQKEREEWMLELPEVGLKGGLAALSSLKRKFHHGKEKPDFSDRTAWTKTPCSDDSNTSKSATSKASSEAMRRETQAAYERQRDEEQDVIARKHKKKYKRDESLVEIHQRKLRREQREKEKKLAATDAKPERRPFSRDVDLKLSNIDRKQTKSIVEKAKLLDTKFATGHAKYL